MVPAGSTTSPPDTSAVLDPVAWAAVPPRAPMAQLARLRDEQPVARASDPDGNRVWLVTRHADIVAVSKDTATFSSRRGVVTLEPLDQHQLDMRRVLMEQDPPVHAAWRRLLNADFTPRAVRGLEEGIRLFTAATLDAIDGSATIDGVVDIAEQVPIKVLCQLLGVPDDRAQELVSLGNRMVSATGDDEAEGMDPEDLRLLPFSHPAALDGLAMARQLAAQRRARPTDDITSLLVHGEVDGRPLTETEFEMTWLFLVLAGNETTRHAISHGLHLLAHRPKLFDQWAADPGLDHTAADEVIRLSSPIVWHKRTATVDTQIAGEPIAAGDAVLLVFASGNRDDRVFTNPDEPDLARSPNPHVSFGRGGPHFCLGAHLARLEVAVVLREFLDRVTTVHPAGPAVRLESNHFNGLRHLPLAVAWR